MNKQTFLTSTAHEQAKALEDLKQAYPRFLYAYQWLMDHKQPKFRGSSLRMMREGAAQVAKILDQCTRLAFPVVSDISTCNSTSTCGVPSTDPADMFVALCEQAGVECRKEYRFHPVRRWRFDYALPAQLIAVEVEGGVWTRGRHVSPRGFLSDMEKYNTATAMGWKVFRVTPSTLLSDGLHLIHAVTSSSDAAPTPAPSSLPSNSSSPHAVTSSSSSAAPTPDTTTTSSFDAAPSPTDLSESKQRSRRRSRHGALD